MSSERTDRINVVLTPAAVEAMSLLQERTGMKKVDVVNRAITLLEFVEGELSQGRELLVHNPRRPAEQSQKVKLFF